MKSYGYATTDEETLLELNAVSLVLNPAELRDIAQFLLKCAEEIEANSEDWAHEHLKDNFPGYDDQVDFVVNNAGFKYDS